MAYSGFVASFPRHLLWQIQPPLQLKQSLPAKARILLPAVVVVEWKTTVEAHPIARGAIPGKIRPGGFGAQQPGRASRLREKGPGCDSEFGRLREETGRLCRRCNRSDAAGRESMKAGTPPRDGDRVYAALDAARSEGEPFCEPSTEWHFLRGFSTWSPLLLGDFRLFSMVRIHHLPPLYTSGYKQAI